MNFYLFRTTALLCFAVILFYGGKAIKFGRLSIRGKKNANAIAIDAQMGLLTLARNATMREINT